MSGERAHVVFVDPPYNVPIAGHVSGKERSATASLPKVSASSAAKNSLAF